MIVTVIQVKWETFIFVDFWKHSFLIIGLAWRGVKAEKNVTSHTEMTKARLI